MNFDEALRSIQDEMQSPDWQEVMDEFVSLLAATPAEHLEDTVNEVARLLVFTLQQTQPDMPELLLYSLPYAFSRLVIDRMAGN